MSRNAIVNHKNSPWTTSKLFNCTRWGQLWDHTHEQHFACSQPVSRLITFPPTSWLLLPWQAKSVRKSQRRRGQSRDIKTGHISEIPMPLLVSSAVTHHASALHFRDLAPFHTTGTNCQRRLSQPMYLGVSPFVPNLEVWYLNLKVSPTEWIGSHPPVPQCWILQCPILILGNINWQRSYA